MNVNAIPSSTPAPVAVPLTLQKETVARLSTDPWQASPEDVHAPIISDFGCNVDQKA